ncbi:MAG TPA: GNAT family N-acetyltransferase [Nakamurella sp.]
MSATDPRIRPIEAADVATVTTMVHDLAAYEKAPEQCHLTEEQLHTALFGPAPALFGLVALDDDQVAGFALYFLNFSTWEGVHGIYLEDLYVRPELRGSGLGAALLTGLAQLALERGYARVEWSVLDWNTPSIDFYLSLGARPMDEWTAFRLTGPALRTAAGTG